MRLSNRVFSFGNEPVSISESNPQNHLMMKKETYSRFRKCVVLALSGCCDGMLCSRKEKQGTGASIRKSYRQLAVAYMILAFLIGGQLLLAAGPSENKPSATSAMK